LFCSVLLRRSLIFLGPPSDPRSLAGLRFRPCALSPPRRALGNVPTSRVAGWNDFLRGLTSPISPTPPGMGSRLFQRFTARRASVGTGPVMDSRPFPDPLADHIRGEVRAPLPVSPARGRAPHRAFLRADATSPTLRGLASRFLGGERGFLGLPRPSRRALGSFSPSGRRRPFPWFFFPALTGGRGEPVRAAPLFAGALLALASLGVAARGRFGGRCLEVYLADRLFRAPRSLLVLRSLPGLRRPFSDLPCFPRLTDEGGVPSGLLPFGAVPVRPATVVCGVQRRFQAYLGEARFSPGRLGRRPSPSLLRMLPFRGFPPFPFIPVHGPPGSLRRWLPLPLGREPFAHASPIQACLDGFLVRIPFPWSYHAAGGSSGGRLQGSVRPSPLARPQSFQAIALTASGFSVHIT